MQKNIIDEAFSETLKILSELIKFQTVSGTSNAKLIEYCEKKLSKLGATSFKTFDDAKQRVNLFSTIPSEQKLNGGGIILSGHTDVVPPGNLKDWTTNPFKPIVKNGILIGRGANDMKSSIAAFVSAVSTFLIKNKKFNGSISLLITGD